MIMRSTSPIESLASFRVGTVEFISPDEIKVVLDVESPDNVALNTGMPRPFPRINGYLLIPIDLGFVVGQITWITIERSNFPVRKGFKDFGLVDLPFPLRKIDLQPIGTVTSDGEKEKFTRGVESFPSVGDVVVLPTESQLKTIIESGKNRRVYIGNSVLVGSAKVMIDPDRLFGRHLAVLGNTGSGKSCSVAGLIRWSIESAKKEIKGDATTNSRFIVLDPNGEYGKAFGDTPQAQVFTVEPTEQAQKIEVPLWLWNTEEWCGFTKATQKTQRPTIIHALKSIKTGRTADVASKEHDLANYLRTLILAVQCAINEGMPWSTDYSPKRNFYDMLSVWKEPISIDDSFNDEQKSSLNNLHTKFQTMINKYTGDGFKKYVYSKKEIDEFVALLNSTYSVMGGDDNALSPIDADSPMPFKGDVFVNAIKASAQLLKNSEYIDSVVNQINTLVKDIRLKSIVDDTDITLEQWLDRYIGKAETLTIIDLSLLPSEIVTALTAVISRLVFEALQRYRKQTKLSLPTVLVVEEAHHFIKRYNDDVESQGSSTLCCKVFERIAREGRKFGLGLLISSQRPSELSPTVLSQCNSFLIHRISNDRDQELVGRLLPDNMRGMLKELPSLPSQNAILLGWASELPVLVKMRTLPEVQRPQSNDPEFWNVWTGQESREVDWSTIAKEWQK